MPTNARFRRALALPVIAALAASGALVGSGTAQAVTPSTTTSASVVAVSAAAQVKAARSARVKKIRRATKIGLRQLGDPYVYGANGPSSFDCSGLTSYAYKRAGISIPRTSDSQAGFARKLKRKRNVRRGDLVFFHSGGDVYHVAMYLGRNSGERIILSAPSTGKNVERSAIWTNSWFAGTLRPRSR